MGGGELNIWLFVVIFYKIRCKDTNFSAYMQEKNKKIAD